ncbi:YqzK family protein [Bacillus infantis]|jgi:hypothetical protein|uniref:YqzK family protein n=1 Tax=Bacillus infantis TaxID=324767 RepID=UPI003CFA9136
MRSWMTMTFKTLKVFVLFTGCTILFYYGLLWLNEEYQSYHRYDEPEGSAVRVSGDSVSDETDWFDRLILFYLNGE